MFTAQNYIKARSLEEAYTLNQKRGNTILGGGCWLRLGQRSIQNLIDLSELGLDQIKEGEDSFSLGAMVTLRQLEQSAALSDAFETAFADMVRHIVGVQFRNCATLGGSVVSRFGFSDILTLLLALDCEVELAGAGRIPLTDYARMPYDRDVLAWIHVKKDGRRVAYESFRNSETDIPVLTCAMSEKDGVVTAVVGARPGRACRVEASLSLNAGEEEWQAFLDKVNQMHFGSNMRASEAYRRHLASVLLRRAFLRLKGE